MNYVKRSLVYFIGWSMAILGLLSGCQTSSVNESTSESTTITVEETEVAIINEPSDSLSIDDPFDPLLEQPPNTESAINTVGCKYETYPDPATSPYILPFAVGESFKTGLANCSSSFHGAGRPDEYAFDFDMPTGTPFIAARAGTVFRVVEDQPSNGGGDGAGNYVVIDHGDNTFALYLHSPQDGIDVAVGDSVEQGDVLGITGRSGLAGYPHLHFIVVSDSPNYPYNGLAISFRNALPAHTALQSYTEYEAAAYN